MVTLKSTPIEKVTPHVTPSFPQPPTGSVHWRRRKERTLCQMAVALRRLCGSRTGPTATDSNLAGSVGVVTYHHVAKQVASDPHLLNVTPETFREQLEGLLAWGYQPCALRDVVRSHQTGQSLVARSFAVVFDDGYHSVYENAWPLLKSLKIPATIFLATAYLDRDGPLPFDACQTGPARCGDTQRPLTTTECEEMLESGLIDLGSHTHMHEDFRGRPEQFAHDLRLSLQLLRKRFGLEDATFSFPYGRFDAEMQRILQQQEVLCGLTAECRCITLSDQVCRDPMGWGRFGATEFDTPHTLAAKLDGWYTWVQQHWRRLQGRRA